ncbi:hypothetical protein GH714_027417 [Hevea brasiliensis]|uniref:glucan endo-1,3-beta-D-glucosidase n=1 Tax=Hevea brasiliensis TaxID=3981 RepID=A0A6A6MRJ2_HEVBR|nr:hypothetical protein GH714_027417 [Hevea brasiliensis]
MLKALANSGIEVMVGITNGEVLGIGESPAAAAAWINKNVASYVPSTNITAIAVGNEVLTSIPNAAAVLVPAMNYLHKALVSSNLNFQVKVSTPQSMDVIPKPFPPSTATFSSTWNSTIYQLLQFLKNTNSMFDAMVDATYYAIDTFNISGIPIIVTETGWPWLGGANEPDATVENAETFNNNLIRRVLNDSGPPIYTLGLSTSNRITGNSSVTFCAAKQNADSAKLQEGLNWACGQGGANCTAIQQGHPCYLPNTYQNHASYAYNDYYQKMHSTGGTCDFDGTATTTTVDPSYGSCIFTGSSNSSTSGRIFPPVAFGPISPQGGSSSLSFETSKAQSLLSSAFLALILL